MIIGEINSDFAKKQNVFYITVPDSLSSVVISVILSRLFKLFQKKKKKKKLFLFYRFLDLLILKAALCGEKKCETNYFCDLIVLIE